MTDICIDNSNSVEKRLSQSSSPKIGNGSDHLCTSLANVSLSHSQYSNNNYVSKSEWVKLNVGGTTFLTTRTTLTKDPGSLLSKLVNEEMGDLVQDGKVSDIFNMPLVFFSI